MRAVKSDRSSALQGGVTEERAVASPQKDNQLRKFFEAAARCAAVGGLCLAMVSTGRAAAKRLNKVSVAASQFPTESGAAPAGLDFGESSPGSKIRRIHGR